MTRTYRLGIVVWLLLLLAAAVLVRRWTHSGAEPGSMADANAPLTVQACSAHLMGDAQVLVLRFNRALDRTQDFTPFLQVVELAPGSDEAAPDKAPSTGPWRLEDSHTLVFANVEPESKYQVRLAAGLRAADGGSSAPAHRCQVRTEQMAPSFFFASRGLVLPAGQNGGLPVVTVNVPEVDIQFLRVEPAQIPRFLHGVSERRPVVRPATENADTDGDYDGYDGRDRDAGESDLRGMASGWSLAWVRSLASSVYLGRFLTDAQPNRRSTTFIPVESIRELQEPGIYIAVMQRPGRFEADYQVSHFYVSDIGLHARRLPQGLDAYATSLRSGRAITDVRFELLNEEGRLLAGSDADEQGHGNFASLPAGTRLLLARRGKELSLVSLGDAALDLSEFYVHGRMQRTTQLFAYSGRDLYRPGERFEVSVLARDGDGRPLPAQTPLAASLMRPDGKLVSVEPWAPHARAQGYFQHAIALPADAQTGTWHLELRADPAAHDADTVFRFKVEEFLPERMKLGLRSAGLPAAQAASVPLTPGEPFQVAVQGDYLYGAPAAGNRLLASLTVERARDALPRQWEGFLFGNITDDKRKTRLELPETTLDAQGAASVDVPLDAGDSASPLALRASFSLLESGGRPVVRSIERVFWPAPALLALRPTFDRDVARENDLAQFELVRVAADGSFAPLPKVALRLIREDREYYWRYDDSRGWHSGYGETDVLVDSQQLALTRRTTVSVPVQWGRYRLEVDDPQTGLQLSYRFYAGWGAQDQEALGNRPDRVQVKLHGAPYASGAKARVTLTPPHDGEALVTVEGDRLLWSRRIAVSARGTELELPIDPAWQRHDLYLSVVAFRPGSAGERVTPARAVGVVHLPLARADRALAVKLDAPAKSEPQTRVPVKVQVSGAGAGPTWVTLSAVDEGILNITHYASPDPYGYFFDRHGYSADMLDLYGRLIEKLDGQRGRLKWGGDSGLRDTRSAPKKVKLVDLFSGPVQLDAQGRAEIALDLPDFNGNLRLMAVAASGERFGRAEANLTVAAPIVAELATPRFIAPGDEATVALDLTNLTSTMQQLTVRLDAQAPVRLREGSRRLALAPQQRATVRFVAEATDAYGLARLDLQVDAEGGPKPLRIRREAALQVLPALPATRSVRRLRLAPGEKLDLGVEAVAGLYSGSAAVSLALSPRPPINAASLLRSLLLYPYGCAEQTTSTAYPYLFVDEAMARRYRLQQFSPAERNERVQFAVARLAGMQSASGRFSLWGTGEGDLWLSAYVTGFLHDARAGGYTVPDAALKRADEALFTALQAAPGRIPALPKLPAGKLSDPRRWAYYAELGDAHRRFAEAAYAGYVLAREQRAPLATLRSLYDKYRDRARSPLPLVHLGLALSLMGDQARAERAYKDALVLPYGDDSGHDWLGDYGSEVRDLAASYALLAQHDALRGPRERLLFDLADRLGGRQWLSTQEQLALLRAAQAADLGADPGAGASPMAAELAVGERLEALTGAGALRNVAAADLAAGVRLSNRSDVPLYAEVEVSGYPRALKAEGASPLHVERSYYRVDGTPYDGGELKVGELLLIHLQVSATRTVEQGLIVDRIPAGFEIDNANLSQGEGLDDLSIAGLNIAQAGADSRIRHREYRDDRFVVAARIGSQPLDLFYLVRVVSPGRYVRPGSYVEDMYRPELRRVVEAGAPIRIVDPRGVSAP